MKPHLKIIPWAGPQNKEAEFLEKLRKDLNTKRKFESQFMHDAKSQHAATIYTAIVNMIEQFQAEVKSDENSG